MRIDNKKVFAVVVTYKRPSILEECLTSVLINSNYKVHHLFIVINDFDIETLSIVKKFEEKYPTRISYEQFDNVGPAGGFYFGLKKFLNSDSDFVWLLDDDIFPRTDCLEKLMQCSIHNSCVMPSVYTNLGNKVEGFGWWGVLIEFNLVKKLGLPIKEFFYWKEDTEYLQNRLIRKLKVIPFRSELAEVTHGHIHKSKKPSWYYYYTIRNTIYYRLNLFPFNNRGRVQLVKTYLGLIYSIMFKENLKLEKLRLLITGTSHGLSGKLGKLDSLHN